MFEGVKETFEHYSRHILDIVDYYCAGSNL